MFSSKKIAYFDYNATAIPFPHLREKLVSAIDAQFANPSSPHQLGREAKSLLEDSRIRIAKTIGVAYQDLTFTSGGSEGNNTILRQLLLKSDPQHIITSQIEHPSVLETCRVLEKMSHIEVTYLPVNAQGIVEPDTLQTAIKPETTLISIMMVNNETGVIQPLEELTNVANEHEVMFHTDCVQGLGKVAMKWEELGVSAATVTAHKFGGPRGVGVLYTKSGSSFEGLITGGKQERVRRAGTENVMLAYGFAEALEWAHEKQTEIAKRLKNYKLRIIDALTAIEGFFLNGPIELSLPHTINFGFETLSADSLLISLDLDHVAVSTGSACSSGAIEVSHVLLAMGFDKQKAKSCLRVSMGWNTTEEEVDYLIDRVQFHAKRLYQKKYAKK